MNILYSKIIGDKPNHLIIVHGLFGQLDNWNTLGKKYAEHYTTHLVDLRNHGRSFHDDDTSHKSMAQDLFNYMDHHNIEKACFIGHSLGGKVVMSLALDFPEKVEKLIVADMAPKSYEPHHNEILKGLKNVDFSQVKVRSDVEEFLKPHIKSNSIRQFLTKSVYRKENESYGFRFNLDALHDNYGSIIANNLPDKQFSKPTLFLGGANSDYILPEDKNLILGYFPNSEIDYVSNATHWLHAENPAEFLAKTKKFLEK